MTAFMQLMARSELNYNFHSEISVFLIYVALMFHILVEYELFSILTRGMERV